MLVLTAAQSIDLAAQAEACLPEETCGLIGGRDGKAELLLPVTNKLHSATRFEMEPREQVRALLEIERAGLTLLAIYHSHPHGPATPSASDVVEHLYPGVFSLILAPGEEGWVLRVFSFST